MGNHFSQEKARPDFFVTKNDQGTQLNEIENQLGE